MTKTILLNAIRIDGGTQSRVGLNADVVADYRELVKSEAKLPPIVAFFDGTDYWLADGFHRFHAYMGEGKASVEADVRTGTQRDAILFSCGANKGHGLRPSNEDKRRAVSLMLADAEWSQRSDRSIAEHCGVSHTAVAKYRNPPPPAPPKTGGGTITGGPESAGKGKPSGNVATDPTAPPPKTEAEIEAEKIAEDAHGGATLASLLDESEATVKRLQEEIKAAESDDLKAETLKWRRIAADGERAKNEAQQKVIDRERTLKTYMGWLVRIGKAVGEEDDMSKIAPTVEAFVRTMRSAA